MTSNVGSRAAAEAPTPIGFGDRVAAQEEKTKNVITKELQSRFAPEFLNRIDDIIIFAKLNKQNIHGIIDVEIKKLAKKLKEMGYTIELTTAVKDFLSEQGYDPDLGARPLRRAISKWIEDPISEEILRKTIKDKILVDYDIKTGKVLINGNQIIEKKIMKWKTFKKI
jgi:ATP-dependent Clp protease ATP-binding subunit ClpC